MARQPANRGGGRGRGRRGRGGRHAPAAPARSPSPAPSSSSEERQEEERVFEFVLRIKDDPAGMKKLPDKFLDFLDGEELIGLHLKEASCNICSWQVDVLEDGRGKLYMHIGWEEFARVHNLSVGCVLTFLYEGDGQMSVKIFDDTCCRRRYNCEH